MPSSGTNVAPALIDQRRIFSNELKKPSDITTAMVLAAVSIVCIDLAPQKTALLQEMSPAGSSQRSATCASVVAQGRSRYPLPFLRR
jgi:hypothetical protein